MHFNQVSKFKAGGGGGKKIALAILAFLIHTANKSIRYLPLIFGFLVGMLFIPADVLFQIKIEWQNSGEFNLNNFSRLLDMARAAIWNIWLLTFVCVAVIDFNYLTFSSHIGPSGKTEKQRTKD